MMATDKEVESVEQLQQAAKKAAHPDEVFTVMDIVEATGASLATVRTWTHRHGDFPIPWKSGRKGEPHLYLREDIERWLIRTGRLVPGGHG